jgi:hypothetical protein
MQGDGRRLVVLFAVVPNPNVLRRQPQHPARATPASAPCRARALDQLAWRVRVSLEHTISIRRFEGFCGSGRSYVRRGAGPDLAQVGRHF